MAVIAPRATLAGVLRLALSCTNQFTIFVRPSRLAEEGSAVDIFKASRM